MRKLWAWSVGLLIIAGPLTAAEPTGKVVLETWDAAYLEDAKAGYVHTIVHQFDQDGQKRFRTSTELNLTVKRFNDDISLRMETGCEEDEKGKVIAVSMKQFLGKDQQLIQNGTVEGKQLHITVDEVRGEQTKRSRDFKNPWNDEVMGLYRQERLFREKKIKPGDQFSYLSFEPSISYVVTTKVTAKDFEDVDLRGVKKQLLRVIAAPDKITVGETSIQLPPLICWLDKEYATLRSQSEIPGLGKLNLYRSTKQQALGQPAGKAAQIKDIGISQLVRLKTRINRAYDTQSAVYRISVKEDDEASTSFARDARQSIKNSKGNTFELTVRALREPKEIEKPASVGKEYTESSYFINSDDPKVKAHAASAVGTEKEPWKKALRIEKWVHDNMTNKNFTEAFATSDNVARTMEGDCTEHAVLAAAMCRAVGIPSRTAFGLVYLEDMRGPAMGFHMWTEAWVRGQWMPIDATLGRGYVGATHLKIADHSWNNTQSLTPLLPVVRVVGKVGIEVVRINEEKE